MVQGEQHEPDQSTEFHENNCGLRPTLLTLDPQELGALDETGPSRYSR